MPQKSPSMLLQVFFLFEYSSLKSSSVSCLTTFGREALDPELCVVMVSTVVIPRPTLAGAASMLIQKDTQDRITVRRLGMYIWIR